MCATWYGSYVSALGHLSRCLFIKLSSERHDLIGNYGLGVDIELIINLVGLGRFEPARAVISDLILIVSTTMPHPCAKIS